MPGRIPARRRDAVMALVGASLVLASLVIIWAARLTVPRELYVSELGADGEPTALAFEAALLLLVAGGVLIAWAVRDLRSRTPGLRAGRPAASLVVACAGFLVASQVPCTAGCPLPVGPTFTAQDFVHTLSAVVAFAAAAWAMLQVAFAPGHRLLSRLSLSAAVSVAVVAGVGGLLSLLQWNDRFGSHLELVATSIGIGWLMVFGVVRFVRLVRAESPTWGTGVVPP